MIKLLKSKVLDFIFFYDIIILTKRLEGEIMCSKIDNVQLKLIKAIRMLVFLCAVASLLAGIWITYSTKVLFSSRASLALVLGASVLICIYTFNKDLKENKIDGTRSIAYFLSLGRCVFFSLTLYGIMENNMALIILFASLAVLFIFLPVWYIALQNRLKVIRDENDKND